MTEAVVRIRGRNELGRAVAAAERDLKKLANTGNLVTKFLKGGAIIAVARQLEVLAENAQKAAEQIGDKNLAAALKQMNDQVDRQKAEAMSNFGKALLLLAGPETARIALQMESIRKEMIWLQEHGEAGGSRYAAIFKELRELEARLEAMGAAASASTLALRRMQAMSRGNTRPIEEWWNKDKGLKETEFPDVVTAQRAGVSGLAAFYAEAEKATRTTTENIFDEWMKLDLQIAELQADAAGQFRISAEEAAKRIAENADKFLQPIEVTAHRMAQPIKEVSQLAIDAANEMRNAFAEFLTTSSDDIDEWASNFIDAMRQILAQAAATQLFSFLGSAVPGLGFLAPRAAGGPVRAGGNYLVGERGPEWFVPSTSGSIVPGGGGASIVVNNMIDARGATTDLLKILPAVLEQNKRETVALAVQATRNRVERTGHL